MEKDLTVSQAKYLKLLDCGTEISVIKLGYDSKNAIKEASVVKILIRSKHNAEIIGCDTIQFTRRQKKAFSELYSIVSSSIITGYNVGYDIRMLYEAAVCAKSNPVLQNFDIMNLAKDLISRDDVGDFQLEHVIQFLFGKSLKKKTCDIAMAEAELFCKLVKMYMEYIPATAHDTKLLKARLSYCPTGGMTRIIFTLENYKDCVYYDADEREWHIKNGMERKVYLPEVIRQFTDMYVKPFNYAGIDELAEKWYSFANSIKKPAKKTDKKKK